MKKILLIEDQDDLRENTSEILRLAFYEVFEAKNGLEGIELAKKIKPDLIICDIMMPLLDGYGVLHMVQNAPEINHTPFIFLSAKSERTDLRKGMDLGADDYITKPFTGTELLTATERRLKKFDLLKLELTNGLDILNHKNLNLNSNDLMTAILKDRHINKYKRKQIIYSEGNRPARLFYILKGQVRVIKTNDEAKELVIGLYKEGDFLGYVPLLENCNYMDSAEAIDDTELALIPREEFDDLMKKDISVVKKFTQLLAKDVVETQEHLIALAYNSLRKKVAQALISLHKTYQKLNEPYWISMSREGLASIAGTATESLIRTLTDFKNEKLIEIKDTKIQIINFNKLDKLLN